MQIEASNNSFSVWVVGYKSASWNFMSVDEYFVVVENLGDQYNKKDYSSPTTVYREVGRNKEFGKSNTNNMLSRISL